MSQITFNRDTVLQDEQGRSPAEKALRWGAAVVVPIALVLDRPVPLVPRLTAATLLVLGLSPFWAPQLLRIRRAPVLLAVSIIFVVGGFLLTLHSEIDHFVRLGVAVPVAITLTTQLLSVGPLVWASRVIGLGPLVSLYSLCLLYQALASPSARSLENPWKSALALPVSLIVLVILDHQRLLWVKLIGLSILGLLCITNDYRSGFGMFLVVALIIVWQAVRRGTVGTSSTGLLIAGLLAVVMVLYYVLERLLVSGFLGAGLQARSEAQVEASGNLLLGGRPEWTVTIRLFLDRPFGFGFGVTPSPVDVGLGEEGFASIHLSAQQGYLRNYVFNGAFRLHSVTADLWTASGVTGLLTAAVLLWILVSCLAARLAFRATSTLQIYVTILALWNIGFSPIFTAFPQVVLAVAIALATTQPRARRRWEPVPLADQDQDTADPGRWPGSRLQETR